MIFLFEQFAYGEKFLQEVLPLEKKGGNWDLPKGFVTKSKSGEFDAPRVFEFVPGEVRDRARQDVRGKCEQGAVQRSDNAQESRTVSEESANRELFPQYRLFGKTRIWCAQDVQVQASIFRCRP